MTKQEFIDREMFGFEKPNEEWNRVFRVAHSINCNTGNYAYGSMTEKRSYLDHTVGWAYTESEARSLLGQAWEEVQDFNAQYEED